MEIIQKPLHLNPFHFRYLLEKLGPSLGLWRAAEIAALREQHYPHPLLDLGCGDGFVMSMVLPRVEIGLDPDRPALERAARLGIYERFEAQPAEDTQLPDGCLGGVVSNSVLEHVPEIDRTLRAVAGMLRPGGTLVTTSPSAAFSRMLISADRGYVARRNRLYQHLNLWSLEEWRDRLAAAGLEVVQARPYMRPGLVRLWDALELLQQVQVRQARAFGKVWRKLPDVFLDRLAQLAAVTDLSAPLPGGGCLLVAVKR